jgi:predicted nucleic acid-binding protein
VTSTRWAHRLSEPHLRPRAVLDADIIYSRVLHELIGRVADDLHLLDLFWSDDLLAETKKSLVEKKGLRDDVAQRWVDHLPENFPAGHTRIDAALNTIDLSGLTSDPGDHHVCALAIASNADYLFTYDRGYLREGLRRHGIEVTTPDQFLAPALDTQPRGMLEILELQANTWAGGQTIEDLLAAIERAGASVFAEKARRTLTM